MTLDEFVGQLPISHCARKEFKALQAKIARLKDEVKRLTDDVTDLEQEGDVIRILCQHGVHGLVRLRPELRRKAR